MRLNSLFIMLGILSANIFALANQASSPIIKESAFVIQPELTNLDRIDKDSDDLDQLNRKIQIEKAQAELKKIENKGDAVLNGSSQNAQTTVTGVAINQEGKKIAWLQFADGGSLTVNIGSRVGKYTVADITMTGVTLSYRVDKAHTQTQHIYLKRSYAPEAKHKQETNSSSNLFFTPSPVLTGANTQNADIVPPIVPNQ